MKEGRIEDGTILLGDDDIVHGLWSGVEYTGKVAIDEKVGEGAFWEEAFTMRALPGWGLEVELEEIESIPALRVLTYTGSHGDTNAIKA